MFPLHEDINGKGEKIISNIKDIIQLIKGG
jgi:hypothetical protein